MEKAYDFKGLVEELKKEGIEVAEEGAKAINRAMFSWLKKSAPLSENKIDDAFAPLYPVIENYIAEVAEQINPHDNEEA